MASVTSRKNRDGTYTWRVQYRIKGAMRQVSFRDAKAAEAYAQLVEKVGGEKAREILDARVNNQPVHTLASFVDEYLSPNSGMLTGVTAGTRAEYRRIADRALLPYLGELPLTIITRDDVAKWVNDLEAQNAKYGGKTLSEKTIRNYHSVLSSILNAAVEREIIPSNPARGIKISRGRRSEAIFLTMPEFETLLYFVDDHYKTFIKFLAQTGMRFGEATALTHGDINYSTSPVTVLVNKAWQKAPNNSVTLGPPKTERGNRTIAIPDALAVEIQDISKKKSDLVFIGKQGGAIRNGPFRTKFWLPALEKANDPELCSQANLPVLGKNPRMHDLRHSHASWLIHQGIPLPAIQRRLGHEKISTTVDTYGHILPDANVQIVNAISMTSQRALE